jgi:hypothetical protein
MKKKIIYLALFILFILATNSYAAPLKLEISVNQDSLKEDSLRRNLGVFEVFYKIKNISDKKQEMTMWTGCSGWSWTSNRPEILPGTHSCRKNDTHTITLKPNEEYKGTLGIAFSTKLKTGPLTFRLGFYPHAGVGEIKTEADIKGIIWSNDVTITIEPRMLQRE